MNLSLDYDNTYTRDPWAWNGFIRLMRGMNHKVYVVTMRKDNGAEGNEVREFLEDKVDGIYFTNRRAKRPFMYDQGISIDVWIDDMPIFVECNAEG